MPEESHAPLPTDLVAATGRHHRERLLKKTLKGVAATGIGTAIGYGVGNLLFGPGVATWATAGLVGAGIGYLATRSPGSVESLIESHNYPWQNLDHYDLSSHRERKEYASLVRQTRDEVHDLHLGFGAMTAEKAQRIRQDIRRVLRARYLQDNGLRLPGELSDQSVSGLRGYLRQENNRWNLADAARSIQKSLDAGEREAPKLLRKAESDLLIERGVEDERLENLSAEEIRGLRNFADCWAPAQQERFLSRALEQSTDPQELRDLMARDILTAHGYSPPEDLDRKTLLSLIRDTEFEDRRNQALILQGVQAGLEAGERNYFVLSRQGNEAILNELGVELKRLQPAPERAAAAYEGKLEESLAERTRVARDLLRVLPPHERGMACQHLYDQGTDLVHLEEHLSEYFGAQLAHLPAEELESMGPMQRANYVSSLSRFPKELLASRESIIQEIESRFSVKVHDEPGFLPGSQQKNETIQPWPLQALVALYNSLEQMYGEKGLTPEITHTTFAFQTGTSESEKSAWTGAAPEDSLFKSPGSKAHAKGKSTNYGTHFTLKNQSVVVLGDSALLGENGDGVAGLSCAENTLLHECGHAQQLGVGYDLSEHKKTHAVAGSVAAWSSISDWREPDGLLADGRRNDWQNYADPAIRLGRPDEVATSYAGQDPVEDYAEYKVRFYADPQTAAKLSLEKLVYCNQKTGYYRESDLEAVATRADFGLHELAKARESLAEKLSGAPEAAGFPS